MMKFNSRHESRDETLLAVREQLLKAALDDLKKDSNVVGVYLAGSLPKANDDRYSDIDLHIVVTKKSLDKFIEGKKERPSHWGQVFSARILTHEDLSWLYILSVL